MSSISDGEGDRSILQTAFELHLARLAFPTAMTNGVRHTLRKREQNIMLNSLWNVRAIELPPRPLMDVLQFFERSGYQQVLHLGK